MKYFTKEELEDITKELLTNPTRETLKSLNEKYNGTIEVGNITLQTMENVNAEPPKAEPVPTLVEVNQVVTPVPNLNVPTMEVPKVTNMVNNSVNAIETPSFEIPRLETPTISKLVNEPINFTGNLWDTPKQEMSNLMQTTDNFNVGSNTMPSTEVPVTGAPFFGQTPESINNPIPVSNTKVQGPTMFGQLEQNYM